MNGLGWAGLAGVQEKAGSQKNQKVSFLIFNFNKKLKARLQGDSFLILGGLAGLAKPGLGWHGLSWAGSGWTRGGRGEGPKRGEGEPGTEKVTFLIRI